MRRSNTYHLVGRLGQCIYMDDTHKRLRRLLSSASKDFIHRVVHSGMIVTEEHRVDTIKTLVAGVGLEWITPNNFKITRRVVDIEEDGRMTIIRLLVYLHDATNGIPKDLIAGFAYDDLCEWADSTMYFWPKQVQTQVVNQMMCHDTEEVGRVFYSPKDIFYKDIR